MEERQLIERAAQDDAAFQELYRRYFPRLYAYLAYRVGSQQDTEDLTSETFLKVVEHLHTFHYRGEGSFAAWLFRIAYNTVNSHFRRHAAYHTPLPLDDVPTIQSHELPLEQALAQKEHFAHLHHLLSQLPTRRQEIITLRFFGGLRNREIADLLGLDERTVASHLVRGLEDLHQHYQQEQL